VDEARHHDMSALVFALIVGLITVILPGSIMFSRIFCYVAADDSGVTVRRIIPTYLIPWSAIQDVCLVPRPHAETDEVSIDTGGTVLMFRTTEREITSLAPVGIDSPGEPMDVVRAKIVLYRDRMRVAGAPPGPVVVLRPAWWLVGIALGMYVLLPIWVLVVYRLVEAIRSA
jgi:hypothetical protein